MGRGLGSLGRASRRLGSRLAWKPSWIQHPGGKPKKALAQAKTAADGRVAKAQEDIRAEDRIEGWKAQLQETQNAADDAPVPAQPAPGQSLSLNPGQHSALLKTFPHSHLK